MVCGLPPPLCATVMVPLAFPAAEGKNVTEI